MPWKSELGLEDAFMDAVTFIEWPDRLGTFLPDDRLDIEIREGDAANARVIRLLPRGTLSSRLDGFMQALD